jgi:hypothetical protein
LEEKFAKFTEAELAVLKIISGEVVRHGACTLTKDAIADRSSIPPGVVRTALHTAKGEGLLEVRQSRHHNTITVSAMWKVWLDRYGDAPPDGPRQAELRGLPNGLIQRTNVRIWRKQICGSFRGRPFLALRVDLAIRATSPPGQCGNARLRGDQRGPRGSRLSAAG